MTKQAPNITGPGQLSSVELDLPSCVKIVTQADAQEFQDFIAKIIQEARTAWERERQT